MYRNPCSRFDDELANQIAPVTDPYPNLAIWFAPKIRSPNDDFIQNWNPLLRKDFYASFLKMGAFQNETSKPALKIAQHMLFRKLA